MTPQEAARLLGGRASGNRVQCPGPNHAKGDQSLTVIFTADGFVVHSFSTSDNWKECKDYVRTKLGLANDWKPDLTTFKPASDPDVRNFEFAMDIWEQSRPIGGTIVERYLSSRAIRLENEITAIRYHPSLKYDGTKYDAMVCLYRDIVTNEPRGVHRTFLRGDSTKIDRRMLASAKGAAIKLDDDDAVTYGLTIGEGVETCLSARQKGYAPTWALMSAQGIGDFPLLPGVDCLTCLGEKDPRRTNEVACKIVGRRWLQADRDVIIHFPRDGKDMNDALKAEANG